MEVSPFSLSLLTLLMSFMDGWPSDRKLEKWICWYLETYQRSLAKLLNAFFVSYLPWHSHKPSDDTLQHFSSGLMIMMIMITIIMTRWVNNDPIRNPPSCMLKKLKTFSKNYYRHILFSFYTNVIVNCTILAFLHYYLFLNRVRYIGLKSIHLFVRRH